ncbi:MAG: FAD-dependent oxidoreductase [Crocinitomicaceae bacterium]|nr:FAD-dependent oxidoreductase [Crocinitomicaceae bacterium]MDG1658070.1 FAD-dependent oxidoreductase [Crocinitomicaceae bacterium]
MIVIIGNGISGVTAARNIRKKSDDAITIISSESKYFFSRTALMYVYMGHMTFEHTQPYEPHFWEKNRIELLQNHVESIESNKKELRFSDGSKMKYDSLIIATGSKPNKFGWKGQDSKRVHGMYSKQDLENIEKSTKGIASAVIVGGGLIGIELAEMLLTRNIEVHFLVRDNGFWSEVLPSQDSQLIMDHLEKHHGLRMHYETELDEVVTNENDEAIGVITKAGRKIECQFVGLTAGVSPNIAVIEGSSIESNRGILVDRFLRTSEADIYAIGDCAEFREPLPGRRPIEQVWYTGKFMGEVVSETITGSPRQYNPGHWFNSAKFFEIEYQTYGDVRATLAEDEEEFVYRHAIEDVLLHFVFKKESHKFIGINNFGIRMRHPVFNDWLLNNATIEEVLSNLKSANFDPEFYTKYESEVVAEFNQKFGASVAVNAPKWWQKIISH